MNTLLEEGSSLSGRERHCAFLNVGTPRWACVSAATGLDLMDDGRAAAVTDWDFDGNLDLWVYNRTAPRVRLLQNRSRSEHLFLAIQLQGTTCNRDAIGARVEIVACRDQAPEAADSQLRLTKTLRAGEGFLSQSSKWLHFGLGDCSRIESATVRWPGGTAEQLQGLEPNGFYQVKQGGNAKAWKPPATTTLSPGPLASPTIDPTSRVFLVSRVPVPGVSYRDSTGQERTLDELPAKPRLISLWTTWCKPCLRELHEWTERQAKLRELGLDILALNVDQLGQPAEEAELRLREMGFPFRSGYATEQLVSALQVVQRTVCDKPSVLPVPSSVLIDQEGYLAAIYLGPVQFEQLAADVSMLQSSLEDRRSYAVPFQGSWLQVPEANDPLLIARKFIDAGRVSAAAAYLERFSRLPGIAAQLSEDNDSHRRRLLSDAWSQVGEAHHQDGQLDAAEQAYQQALVWSAEAPEVHLALGKLDEEANRAEAAVDHYEAAVRAAPDDLSARKRLVLALARLNRFQGMLIHVQQLSEADPYDANAHMYLAKSLVANDNPRAAIRAYRRAIELAPEWLLPINDLAWLLATHPDETIRDPQEAVLLAETAAKSTEYQNPAVLDTLAAAYASAGRFAEAIERLEAAIPLAKGKSESLRAPMMQRLRLYQAGHDFVEKSTNVP